MIQVQIWGDFECPYSYFQALELNKLKVHYGAGLEITWRALELSPQLAPIGPSIEYVTNFNQACLEPIVDELNLQLHVPVVLNHTWLAQECVCFANSENRSLPLAIAIFEAVFSKGIDISSEDEIFKLAAQVGIDSKQLSDAIDNGALTKQVLFDEAEFKAFGFQGVPAMLIGEKNFSPKSFIPVNGYKTSDDLMRFIPKNAIIS